MVNEALNYHRPTPTLPVGIACHREGDVLTILIPGSRIWPRIVGWAILLLLTGIPALIITTVTAMRIVVQAGLEITVWLACSAVCFDLLALFSVRHLLHLAQHGRKPHVLRASSQTLEYEGPGTSQAPRYTVSREALSEIYLKPRGRGKSPVLSVEVDFETLTAELFTVPWRTGPEMNAMEDDLRQVLSLQPIKRGIS